MAKADDQLGPKTIPPFAALRAFEAVFRTGGIRKAAESLSLTHAVVSRHVRLLEEWLGRPVVGRAGNRLSLNEAGARYHSRVSAILLDLAEATREVRGELELNRLRLWCVPGLATQWLSSQLAEFEQCHQQYSVELKPTDRCADLLHHEADVDIRYYGDEWPPGPGGRGLKYVELARPPVMVVASPILAGRLRLNSPSDLLGGPLLHEDSDNEWRHWLLRNGVKNIPVELPGPLYWHAHLAIAAALRGRGVALANPYLISTSLDRGELVELVIPGSRRVPLGSYMIVAREDRWSIPALIALRQFLKDRAGRHVEPKKHRRGSLRNL